MVSPRTFHPGPHTQPVGCPVLASLPGWAVVWVPLGYVAPEACAGSGREEEEEELLSSKFCWQGAPSCPVTPRSRRRRTAPFIVSLHGVTTEQIPNVPFSQHLFLPPTEALLRGMLASPHSQEKREEFVTDVIRCLELPPWHSGLRIQHCCSCHLDSIPGLGISMLRVHPKKKKKKKEKMSDD